MQNQLLRSKRPKLSLAALDLPSNNTAPNWWSDPGLRRLTGWLVVVFLSQLCTGFDATLTANFQSFESWKVGKNIRRSKSLFSFNETKSHRFPDMGHPSSSRLGLITSIYFVGTLAGSIPGSIVADRWYRDIT